MEILKILSKLLNWLSAVGFLVLLAIAFRYWYIHYKWSRKNQPKTIEPGRIVFFYEGDTRHMGRIIEYRHPVVKIRDFRTRELTTRLTSEISITS